MPSEAASPSFRLPIDHPEYRYPESRNPYWTKIQELSARILSDNGTEEYRGKWRERFTDARDAGDAVDAAAPAAKSAAKASGRRPLHVEIGCNAGHVALEWAARARESAHIGIDWKFKPIFRGAEKAEKRGLENLLFFRAHAERLHYMFGPGEIDFLYLFFPDPWPRKKQWKNRFLTAERLRAVAPILHPQGVFHIKTDHPGYFEWMENAVRGVSDLWEVVERTDDLHKNNPNPTSLKIPEVTLFERLFIKDGIRINSLKLRRKPSA